MQTILIFVLVVLLLAADAFIFFAVGTAYMTGKTIKKLREDGWIVEPPENKKEDK